MLTDAALRARARITWHFAAGPQARWRGAGDELYPGWYVRSEQQSQRACGPQPERARRRGGICFVAAPRRCTPTSPASRRLASAHPALEPKCQLILARALSSLLQTPDCQRAGLHLMRVGTLSPATVYDQCLQMTRIKHCAPARGFGSLPTKPRPFAIGNGIAFADQNSSTPSKTQRPQDS